MLVLGRKLGESIRIGPDVLLTVVRIKGDDVRIGIDAPKEIEIMRSELDARPLRTPDWSAVRMRLNEVGVHPTGLVFHAKRERISPEEIMAIIQTYELSQEEFRGPNAIAVRIMTGDWPVTQSGDAVRCVQEHFDGGRV